MSESKRVPALRFKGFTDPWEQRKLGEVASFGGGHTPCMAVSENYSIGEGVLWVTSQDVKVDYLSNTASKLTVQGSSELRTYDVGTLVLVARSGILRHTLPISMLVKPATVNQDIKAIIPEGDTSGSFLMQYFKAKSKLILREYGKTGTTVESVDFSKMKGMVIPVADQEEQSQIGNLFAKLDSLITLHQRKYDKLVVLKKSLLEKMFPKPDSKVPEIRFSGFTDPWEQRKLGEEVSFFSGLTYSPSDVVKDSGALVLRSSNVQSSEIVLDDNIFVRKEATYSEQVRSGDIIVVVRNGTRSLIGKHAIIRENMPDTVIGAFMTGVRAERPEFVNALLSTPSFDAEVEKNLGATINQITGGMFSAMAFVFPDSEERQAIGNLFAKLDSLITLHQRELDVLKNVKKSLLEKMFI